MAIITPPPLTRNVTPSGVPRAPTTPPALEDPAATGVCDGIPVSRSRSQSSAMVAAEFTRPPPFRTAYGGSGSARGRDARAHFEGDLAVLVAADHRCPGTMSLFPPDGCPLLRRLRRTVWITKTLRQGLEHQTPSISSMRSQEPRRTKIIELVLIGQRRRRKERTAPSQGAVVWRVLSRPTARRVLRSQPTVCWVGHRTAPRMLSRPWY